MIELDKIVKPDEIVTEAELHDAIQAFQRADHQRINIPRDSAAPYMDREVALIQSATSMVQMWHKITETPGVEVAPGSHMQKMLAAAIEFLEDRFKDAVCTNSTDCDNGPGPQQPQPTVVEKRPFHKNGAFDREKWEAATKAPYKIQCACGHVNPLISNCQKCGAPLGAVGSTGHEGATGTRGEP